MQWDLGLQGVAVLVAMSLGIGLVAQVWVGRSTTRWVGLIAAATYFVSGLFISEVWFGWATEEDLQPNIDGLSFDEVLLIGLVPGIAAVLVTRYVTRRRRRGTTEVGARPGPAPGVTSLLADRGVVVDQVAVVAPDQVDPVPFHLDAAVVHRVAQGEVDSVAVR